MEKKTVNYTWVGGGSPRLRQKAVAPVCSKHQHAIFCYKIGLALFPPNVGHLMTATLFPLLPSITNNPGFNRYYKPKGEEHWRPLDNFPTFVGNTRGPHIFRCPSGTLLSIIIF